MDRAYAIRVTALATLLAAVAPPAARAQDAPVTHPVFSMLPDVPHADDAHRAFTAVAGRYRLGPVEVVDVPAGAAPVAAKQLEQGKAALRDLKFDEANLALEGAAAEAIRTGGAGLTRETLADVFLFRAWADQRADWKDPSGPITSIVASKAREAYSRAATLVPTRSLPPRQFPPLVMESWRIAVAEVKGRPRGSIVVRASPSALISVDADPPRPSPVALPDVVFGDHFIRVEDPGRQVWAQVVPMTQQTLEVDVPEQPSLALDDAEAISRARRQGASFALVAELKPGSPQQIELRLIDADNRARRDSTSVPFPGDAAALEAAVMRFDEDARKVAMGRGGATGAGSGSSILIEPAPPKAVAEPSATGGGEAGSWLRARWPLLTAVGVAVATAVVLGLVVSGSKNR